MTEQAKRRSRRAFLLAAGAAGGTAAAAAATRYAPAAPTGGKDRRPARGYHASEHVNNYYRTTKV